MKQKELREKMPIIADWVDQMVAAFGKEVIHGQIRRGLAGEPCFVARENGRVIGTAPTRGSYCVRWDERDAARVEPIEAPAREG